MASVMAMSQRPYKAQGVTIDHVYVLHSSSTSQSTVVYAR